uniref:Uncharacterized protein n=1 Tax=Opuntia streptacantha TaxID=393608 RepID=A0A7C9EB71_OPUST
MVLNPAMNSSNLFFLHSSYCLFISSRSWVTALSSSTRSLYDATFLRYSEIESRLGFISFSCASSSVTISKARFRSQDLVRLSSARVPWSFSWSTESFAICSICFLRVFCKSSSFLLYAFPFISISLQSFFISLSLKSASTSVARSSSIFLFRLSYSDFALSRTSLCSSISCCVFL